MATAISQKPLIQVRDSRSHRVRPQFSGSKGEDTCNKGRWSTMQCVLTYYEINFLINIFLDKISADISQIFVQKMATDYSYTNYLIRNVAGLSGLTVPTPCQIECLFSADCHFVILVVSTSCAVGNFKLPYTSFGLVNARTASIFKGRCHSRCFSFP